MNKKYWIKVYNLDWTFKQTMSVSERMTDISYTAQINWWQWELNIDLNIPISDVTFVSWDIARVYVFSEVYPNGYLVYSWIIQRIDKKFESWNEYITLTCLWLASMLQFVQNNMTRNQDPAQTIKDIIDYFNTKYTWNWIRYDWWFVENYWSNINITFTNKNCFERLRELVKCTIFWRYIWAECQFTFQPYPTSANHKTTAQKDLQSLNIQIDSERIYNKLYLKYNWGTSTYQDLTSISTYWLKEKYEDKSSTLNNLTSADSYWNTFIRDNKDPKAKINWIINDNFRTIGYNLWDNTLTWDNAWIWNDIWTWQNRWWTDWIEHLNPWDTLTIQNISIPYVNKQITKITYNWDTISFNLSEFDTIWKEIFT